MGVLDLVKDVFSGRTDKYLNAALEGTDVLDVSGTFWTDHQRDYTHTRLARYKQNWRFYRGDHFTKKTLEGKRKLVINLCRPIVNKSVDWLFGNGFRIVAPTGNEAVLPVLDLVWDKNGRDLMMWEHGQMGAVTGDAFLYVSVSDRDSAGKPLPPEKQKIVIRNLNSAYVHPVYDTADSREMLACLIQFPVTQIPKSTNDAFGSRVVTQGTRPLGLYSVVLTRTEIAEYWNRSLIQGSRRPNFIGEIPVVHTRNIPVSNSFFGASDIEDIIPLNEEYNSVAEDIDSIIKYHAAPTTFIFGARMQNIEATPGKKLYSGLPRDARVENLRLEGELQAATQHLEFLKLAMHELSNTPETSLGKVQEISNTSAAALEVQYLPLMEKTRRKYLTYGESIARVNKLILLIVGKRFGVDISKLTGDDARMFDTTVEFASPLPQDKKLHMDLLAAKLKEGLESMHGALRSLGERDPMRKTLEIIADKRAVLAEDIERTLASSGGKVPNLSVVQLGSLGLAYPELLSAFRKQDEELEKAITQAKEDVEEEARKKAEKETSLRPGIPGEEEVA